MSASLTIVVSQGQSRNPEKRSLERAVAEAAAGIDGANVLLIGHLYDLKPAGETATQLKQIQGDLIVVSWLFERATHWVLDRLGIRGQIGEVELVREDDEDEDEELSADDEDQERVVDAVPRPDRKIYSLDFRVSNSADEFLAEIRRIAGMARMAHPANDTALAVEGGALERTAQTDDRPSYNPAELPLVQIDEHPGRRWYPVIDFSRCTNCMECIDFCLFGVYGVDDAETILVEQPDNCRKGCPACSRVCPANAIMFPQHKTPAIAGAEADAGGFKIDLSKLFGAPEKDEDAVDAAVRERDEQLLLAGRAAVGESVGIRRRDSDPDELDTLVDQLEAFDL